MRFLITRVSRTRIDVKVIIIIMAEFAARNLLYGPKFQRKAHFGALNLFTSEKRLKLSYKTSTNLEFYYGFIIEDLDFDFVLQDFKPCLFVNKGDEETNS